MFLGIDLGTCFSQAATVSMDRPLVLLPPSEYGIASEFYYDSRQGVLVGQEALDAAQGFDTANLKSGVKMDLGSSFTADGKTFSSTDMLKAIFGSIMEKAVYVADTRMIPSDIEGVVLSHPAKFTMQECNLLRTAAEQALEGTPLKVTGMIKEPVAAALSYYQAAIDNGTGVLVFDLGGGTCDVALVRADDSLSARFDVVDSDMLRLGGRDWDRKLTDYITDQFETATGLVVRDNSEYMEKIRRTANTVKHKLSAPNCESVNARVEAGGTFHSIPVTRTAFDEMTMELLNQALDCLERVYERNPDCPIREIICVGGSSNMPQVRDGIRARFPDRTVRLFQPEHAVVSGVALYAHMLGANPMPITDFLPFSYGIRCLDSATQKLIVENILKKGDQFPATGSHVFYPIKDNCTFVLIHVFESEHGDNYPAGDPDARKVGEMRLTIPGGATTSTPILCRITLDDMSIIRVSATDDQGNHIQADFTVNAICN